MCVQLKLLGSICLLLMWIAGCIDMAGALLKLLNTKTEWNTLDVANYLAKMKHTICRWVDNSPVAFYAVDSSIASRVWVWVWCRISIMEVACRLGHNLFTFIKSSPTRHSCVWYFRMIWIHLFSDFHLFFLKLEHFHWITLCLRPESIYWLRWIETDLILKISVCIHCRVIFCFKVFVFCCFICY